MKKHVKYLIFGFLFLIILGGFAWFFNRSSVEPVQVSDTQTENSETKAKIIAFGDSLTAGYGVLLDESYPAILEKKLVDAGFDVDVVNAGVSGETTKGNLERAEFITKQKPDIVLLGIGGNDALRNLSLNETKKNISETIKLLLSGQNPPKVLLLKMQAPLNSGLEYKQNFDSIYTELSKQYGVTLVPFITEEVFLNSKYKLEDGIHLNREGYEQIVENYILQSVVDLLNSK